MNKTKRKKPLRGIAKTGRGSKLDTGGKKMNDPGYVNGLKLGPKGTYIYRIKVYGKVRTGDTAQTRLFEAENELVQIRAAFLQDSLGTLKKKAPTFKVACDLWKKEKIEILSKDYVEGCFRLMELHFIPKIGHKVVYKITKEDFRACFTAYIQKTQKGKEIKNFGGYNKLINYVKAIMTYMVECKYLSSYEVPEPEKSQERSYDVLTKEEIGKLFQEAKKRYGMTRTVGLALGCYLGLRASEICNSRWDFIDWENKKFKNTITTTKNKKSILLPMADELIDMLKELKGDEEKLGFIMVRPNGEKYSRKFAEHILPYLGRKHFKKYLTAHSLRRSFITILHSKKILPKVMQNLARHSSLNQTFHYIQVGEEDREQAIQEVFNQKSS